MTALHTVLAPLSAGISELKKNPMAIIDQAKGQSVAILNRNQPVFYAVPAATYQQLLDRIEDLEIKATVAERAQQQEIPVTLDELSTELQGGGT